MDPDALHARLQAALLSTSVNERFARSAPPSPSSTAPTTTPPPDLEAEAKLWHEMEDEARNLLEQDGCPPCYPPDPSFSVQNPPEEYRGITSYWDWFAPTGGGALHAQWEDWCKFRNFQERNRRYYAPQRFEQFTKAVRERRRRHNLSEDDVCLRLNAKEQTRQENWIEFQDYHLRFYEDFEKKAETESKNLETETAKLPGLAGSELEIATHNQMAYRYRLAFANEKMELHQQRLLPWIERERIKMTVITQSAPADDIRKTPTPSTRNRSKSSKIRSGPNVVPSSTVSKRKPESRTRSLRNQQPELLQSPRPKESTTCDFFKASESAITLQTHNNNHLPHEKEEPRRTITARGSAAASPRALHPQKVTNPVKVKNFGKSKQQQANINIDASPRRRLLPLSRKVDQRKLKPKLKEKPPPPPPRSRFMYQNLTEEDLLVTKSGRVSKRPTRSGFVAY